MVKRAREWQRFEPLRIEAYFGSPYVGDVYAPLDGILLYAAIEGSDIFEHAQTPGIDLDYDPAIVPLAICQFSDGWFYKCSFAKWSAYVDGVSYWNRRADQDAADRYLHTELEVGKGPDKAYHTAISYRSASLACWYAVGDMQAIGKLLEQVNHIGKKRESGWGHVLQWSVKRAQDDYSLFGPNREPMRALPVQFVQERFGEWPIDWPLSRRAYRPPYWSVRNVDDVFVPKE